MMFTEACKENNGEVSSPPAGALYLHVPFCLAKCRYCDFYSRPVRSAPAGLFVGAVAAELDARRHLLRTPLETAFVGGGTPTCLGPDLLAELLALLGPLIGAGTEFSVEANPGTIDEPTAAVLAGAAVNRVNLGAQSFQDQELRVLGRVHSAGQMREAFALLRSAGLGNLGVDLIYGIPGQDLDSWDRSLAEALALRPQHLSCYCLSFEPGTPLAADLRAGTLAEMPEDLQEACYRRAIAAAAEAGLQHYEISNFALPGRQCRHNLTYWHNQPYLALGPAAASYIGSVRQTNISDVDAYISAVLAGRPAPADREKLTGRASMAETAMLALRLMEGLDRAEFRRRFGQDLAEAFPAAVGRYVRQGALLADEARIRIAPGRLFVADTILADLLAEV